MHEMYPKLERVMQCTIAGCIWHCEKKFVSLKPRDDE